MDPVALDRKQDYAASHEPLLARVMEALALARPTVDVAKFIADVTNEVSTSVPTGATDAEPASDDELAIWFKAFADGILQDMLRQLVVEAPSDVKAWISEYCDNVPSHLVAAAPAPAASESKLDTASPSGQSTGSGAVTRGALLSGRYNVVTVTTSEDSVYFRAYNPADSTTLYRTIPKDTPGVSEILEADPKLYTGILKRLALEEPEGEGAVLVYN